MSVKYCSWCVTRMQSLSCGTLNIMSYLSAVISSSLDAYDLPSESLWHNFRKCVCQRACPPPIMDRPRGKCPPADKWHVQDLCAPAGHHSDWCRAHQQSCNRHAEESPNHVPVHIRVWPHCNYGHQMNDNRKKKLVIEPNMFISKTYRFSSYSSVNRIFCWILASKSHGSCAA